MLTKDTGIIDAVQNHPEILEVFAEYGLGCVGCMAPTALMLTLSLPTATKLLKLQKNKTAA